MSIVIVVKHERSSPRSRGRSRNVRRSSVRRHAFDSDRYWSVHLPFTSLWMRGCISVVTRRSFSVSQQLRRNRLHRLGAIMSIVASILCRNFRDLAPAHLLRLEVFVQQIQRFLVRGRAAGDGEHPLTRLIMRRLGDADACA